MYHRLGHADILRTLPGKEHHYRRLSCVVGQFVELSPNITSIVYATAQCERWTIPSPKKPSDSSGKHFEREISNLRSTGKHRQARLLLCALARCHRLSTVVGYTGRSMSLMQIANLRHAIQMSANGDWAHSFPAFLCRSFLASLLTSALTWLLSSCIREHSAVTQRVICSLKGC